MKVENWEQLELTKSCIRAIKKHMIERVFILKPQSTNWWQQTVSWILLLQDIGHIKIPLSIIHKRILILFGLLDFHKAEYNSFSKGEEDIR